MKVKSLTFFAIIFLSSCSFKNQIVYIKDANKIEANSWTDYSNFYNKVETGDILKIDVFSVIPEASFAYNKSSNISSFQKNIEILKIEGYLVDESKNIKFPVLGKINVEDLSEVEIEEKITKLLIEGNHLTSPSVKVKRINNKFTILGEVKTPGTYSYLDKKINIFQALGYAGDLTIDGKRKDITIVREIDGIKNVYKIELTKADFLSSPLYNIKNNDVIIVNPTFNKIKSAGFIGNPSSVASIASLLLSITLLITNN
ncbi:polysaccharide biosynthesis/export family protein [Bacteroidota bacterium]|nr:polysaccharide biosynthesis/export family protein [Bacteroidota bacterium]